MHISEILKNTGISQFLTIRNTSQNQLMEPRVRLNSQHAREFSSVSHHLSSYIRAEHRIPVSRRVGSRKSQRR